jgi:predicted dinucleotide-binding enzyme
MPNKIGILGKGNVGTALGNGLSRAGHEVRRAGKDKSTIRDVAGWADIVVVAVPYAAVGDAVNAAGQALDGKTVIDATNPFAADMSMAVDGTTSSAEELQKRAPKAHVVKAFNTVFAHFMERGRFGDQPVSTFVASDDAAAKKLALELARALGFDAIDVGPLENARILESMAHLEIQLGFVLGMGPQIGWKLLHS